MGLELIASVIVSLKTYVRTFRPILCAHDVNFRIKAAILFKVFQ